MVGEGGTGSASPAAGNRAPLARSTSCTACCSFFPAAASFPVPRNRRHERVPARGQPSAFLLLPLPAHRWTPASPRALMPVSHLVCPRPRCDIPARRAAVNRTFLNHNGLEEAGARGNAATGSHVAVLLPWGRELALRAAVPRGVPRVLAGLPESTIHFWVWERRAFADVGAAVLGL